MDIKKIDPWLLKAIEDAVGFPDKPYDLTKVKAITKWRNKCDPQLQLWRGGMLARDWLDRLWRRWTFAIRGWLERRGR